jgi:hypothetical protein
MHKKTLFISMVCVVVLMVIGVLTLVVLNFFPIQSQDATVEKSVTERGDGTETGKADDTQVDTQTQPQVSAGTAPDTYWVTNPSSGSKLYVKVIHPDDWNGQGRVRIA